MKDPSCIVLFITTSSRKEAEKIANTLLGEKLVACANMLDGVHSLFWWQGEIDSSNEVFLMVKTKSALLQEIIHRVKELHSYDVPEIIALPIVGGSQEYLSWINESVKDQPI